MRYLIFLVVFASFTLSAQEEEEYDYDNVQYAGGSAKEYANAKIVGLSPAKFVQIAWDMQTPYSIQTSAPGNYAPDSEWEPQQKGRVNYTGGLRLNANIPIISRNNIIWQAGFNYMQTRFNIKDIEGVNTNFLTELNSKSLQSTSVFSTVYKPLNAKQFLLFQGQIDYNGNYTLSTLHSFNLIKYQWAAIWGKRPSDYKQWGIGLSRTYRVGALNYIPVILYNSTSKNRKWGTEILFPARAHGRYNFSNNNLILFGYELEGGSYHFRNLSEGNNSFELRRGEIRPRIEWQKQLVGYFWGNLQVGSRLDYSFMADNLKDGKEFYRGFFGQKEVTQFSSLATSAYFLIGISFVSP